MSVEREMSLAEWCAKLPSQHVVNRELATLTKQLSALAEQNEKLSHENASLVSRCLQLREALYLFPEDPNPYTYRQCYKRAAEALSLPNLASPVLNRIRAEAKAEENEACAKVLRDNADACGEESIMRHILESQILAIRARRK